MPLACESSINSGRARDRDSGVEWLCDRKRQGERTWYWTADVVPGHDFEVMTYAPSRRDLKFARRKVSWLERGVRARWGSAF